MKLTQSWVGYIDRSYEQIKRSILSRLVNNAPEITDHSESNPLIVLISLFSGVSEVIHLYLDSFAREAFLGTARKYASGVKLVKLIDYTVKARSSATVDILISLTDDNGLPTTSTTDITIPINTLLYPVNSIIPFRLIRTTIIPAGKSAAYGMFGQFTAKQAEILGVTDGSGTPKQSFVVDPLYVHNSMKVFINGQRWALYNSFGLMNSLTKGVVIEIDENAVAKLVFGDGINGAIPPNNTQVIIDYYQTEGVSGNLPPNTITFLSSTISLPAGLNLSFNNPGYSSGGSDFEDLEKIRDLAPRSIRTLDRAVTYQDYIDVAMQVPGVGAAEVKYCCGKYVDVYIAPNSQGTATTALVSMVKNHMDCRIMITTRVDVKPAGVSRVWIKGKIYGKPLETSASILSQVLEKLDEDFGMGNIKINRKVSITDIISSIESLSKVDTIEISEARVEPYARPQNNTANVLNIQFTSLPSTTIKSTFIIIYKSVPDNFEIYKNGVFLISKSVNDIYSDTEIGFKMLAGTYTNNDKWQFTVFPSYPEIFPNTLININDYSAPIIEVSPFVSEDLPRTIFGDLEIIEQGSSSSCLPPCE